MFKADIIYKYKYIYINNKNIDAKNDDKQQNFKKFVEDILIFWILADLDKKKTKILTIIKNKIIINMYFNKIKFKK